MTNTILSLVAVILRGLGHLQESLIKIERSSDQDKLSHPEILVLVS